MSNTILRFSFVFALFGLLGSLYFSEVLHYPPCVLCWYQRICMYPLVFIFGVGLALDDKKVWLYALPLSVIGFIIALYHNLIYYDIVSAGLVPCQKNLSCTTKQIEWLGFITIPLMSLMAFLMFNLMGIWAIVRGKGNSI